VAFRELLSPRRQGTIDDFGLGEMRFCIRARLTVVPKPLYKKITASAPVMAIPSRRSDNQTAPQYRRTFFVTSKTSMGRGLLQSDRVAALLVDVLRSYMAAGRFVIHDFVVMPNHIHVLISVGADISIEKAMQFIKGGFSYRVKKELGYSGEVWQRGFSEVRVECEESFRRHREYIARNPVRAGLVKEGEDFAWCFEALKKRKAAGAGSPDGSGLIGTTEVVP
jgi:putative transposase